MAGVHGEHPRYMRVTAGCKHFDVHAGPENIPTSRFSFNAKVNIWNEQMAVLYVACIMLSELSGEKVIDVQIVENYL